MIDWSATRQTKFRYYLLKAVRGHKNDTCVRQFYACTHDIQRVGALGCAQKACWVAHSGASLVVPSATAKAEAWQF